MNMAYYDDLTYKRKEVETYLNDRVKELKQYLQDEYGAKAKDKFAQLVKDGDLHNQFFNEDYYIIGRYEAKQWLGDQVFDVISIIQEYENDNFGEVNTELDNPEKVVNMYVYIVGEDIMANDERFNR